MEIAATYNLGPGVGVSTALRAGSFENQNGLDNDFIEILAGTSLSF